MDTKLSDLRLTQIINKKVKQIYRNLDRLYSGKLSLPRYRALQGLMNKDWDRIYETCDPEQINKIYNIIVEKRQP